MNSISKEWFYERSWTIKTGWISIEEESSVSHKEGPIKVIFEEIHLFRGDLLVKKEIQLGISLKCSYTG